MALLATPGSRRRTCPPGFWGVSSSQGSFLGGPSKGLYYIGLYKRSSYLCRLPLLAGCYFGMKASKGTRNPKPPIVDPYDVGLRI